MPSTRYTRIEITEEAYMGLEAEAVLRGMTLKKLASDLILRSISAKALEFVKQAQTPASSPTVLKEMENFKQSDHESPKISKNKAAIERIKELWSQEPRPSQREIARIINYPASSTKYQIKAMLEREELKP